MIIGELLSRQIVSLAEQGAPVSEICSTLDVDEATIKLVLAATHTSNGIEDDADITDEDLKTLRRHALQLATNAEDESVQAKMTVFLIERKRPSKRENISSPIFNINKAIIDASSKFNALVKEYSATNETKTNGHADIQAVEASKEDTLEESTEEA